MRATWGLAVPPEVMADVSDEDRDAYVAEFRRYLIVANDVSRNDIGFDSNENEILLVFPDRIERPAKASKTHLSRLILDCATQLATSGNTDDLPKT